MPAIVHGEVLTATGFNWDTAIPLTWRVDGLSILFMLMGTVMRRPAAGGVAVATALGLTLLGGALLTGILVLAGCASLQEALKPTAIEEVNYKPVAKPAWKDFRYSDVYWRYDFAANLSERIRDGLVEGLVEDKIFKVQDKPTGAKYLYKVGIDITNPLIQVSSAGTIQHMSATFRIKTYDAKDNLITAKTRDVVYDAPMVTIAVNNSQDKLLNAYIHNASEDIRKTFYESLK